MAETKIFGYASKLSVKQGETLDFHVSADGTNSAEAQFVRLIHGDENPDGPGFVEQQIDHPINGTWAVKKQFSQLGSYLVIEDDQQKLALSESFSLFCFIWPTLPHLGQRQSVIGRWDTRTNEGFGL